MAELSSINFKKSNAINTEHNDRTLPPNYLLSDSLGVECNLSHDKARLLKNQIISSAIEKYTARTGQKFQSKSYEWSAVVNLKPSSTMAELEKLAAHLQEKYGFQCYQIAIHRDEGHINEKGENVLNHHAHLEFITLDKETGKNTFRSISKKDLRQIQDEVAEILQMKRGVDKRLSGAKRIEPRAYAKMKENEKKTRAKELENIKHKHEKEIKETKFQANKEFLEMQDKKDDEISSLKRKFNKELEAQKNALFEQTRKEMIVEKTNSKKYYDELSQLKKALVGDKNATLEQASNTIKELRQSQKIRQEQEKIIKELDEKLAQMNRNGSNFAENQKNDDLPQKNDLNDLRPILSERITSSCIYALNSAFYSIKETRNNEKIDNLKKQERIKIFENRCLALKESSLKAFNEWEKENPNYKNILENYKIPNKQQEKAQNLSR